MTEDQKPKPKHHTEWPTPMKNCIKALHDDAGWSKRQIPKELRVPRTTVRRLPESNNVRRNG